MAPHSTFSANPRGEQEWAQTKNKGRRRLAQSPIGKKNLIDTQPYRHTAMAAQGPFGTKPYRHTDLSTHRPIGTQTDRHTALSAHSPIGTQPLSAHNPSSTKPHRYGIERIQQNTSKQCALCMKQRESSPILRAVRALARTGANPSDV